MATGRPGPVWAAHSFRDRRSRRTPNGQIGVWAVDRANRLNFNRQKPRGQEWSGWTNLGGQVQPPAAVGQDADGRLEVFILDRSGDVQHLWQTNIHGGWSDWTAMGGTMQPGLVVAKNLDGHLELFGLEAGGDSLLHCWQKQAGGNDWTGWTSLGGSISPGFAVGCSADGRLEVFAVARTNGAVWRRCQTSPSGGEGWGAWENFGGDLKPGLAVAQNADGRLEVFGVNRNGDELMHRWQSRQPLRGDNWSRWHNRAGSVRPTPAVENNQDGNLEIFAIDRNGDGTVDHNRQISGNLDWLYWSSMDQSALEYASRVWQTDEGLPDNRVQAITQTPDGYLWVGTFKGLVRFERGRVQDLQWHQHAGVDKRLDHSVVFRRGRRIVDWDRRRGLGVAAAGPVYPVHTAGRAGGR